MNITPNQPADKLVKRSDKVAMKLGLETIFIQEKYSIGNLILLNPKGTVNTGSAKDTDLTAKRRKYLDYYSNPFIESERCEAISPGGCVTGV